jgi:ABC-2 type transport system ATP-binding protein
VYVLAGANGAGKTTLFELLLDLQRADGGAMEVFGLDPVARGPEVRARTGYVAADRDGAYGWMTVGHLLRHHAAFYPAWDAAYADRLVRLFELPLGRRFGVLSRGLARRVQLVLALAHRPPLLLLDEPTEGLDRVARDELMGLLVEHLAETPTTILVATHQLHEVERLADHLGVLRDGRLVAQLTCERLHRTLRRYRATVPERWTAPAALDGAVVRREATGRELQWVVWGDEAGVAGQLTESGATVQEAAPLSLDDAVLALLRG